MRIYVALNASVFYCDSCAGTVYITLVLCTDGIK